MNIYGMLRAFADNLPSTAQRERGESLALIDALERQNSFGTVAKITELSHRFTRESPISPRCGLCGLIETEHEDE